MIKNKYINDYLEHNAKNIGAKAALVCEDRSLNWSEVYSESNIVSNYLLELLTNQDKQQVVAILLPNSWQFVIGYYGIVTSGHMAMPIDISYKKLEIDNILNKIKPSLIITDHDHLRLFSKKIKTLIVTDIPTKISSFPPRKIHLLPPKQQISTLFYASGTTGKPKAIPNTHRNQLWDVKSISKPMKWTNSDTLLVSLPLSHRHGLVIGILGGLYHGNTTFLQKHFDPDATLNLINSGNISIFFGVPAIYKKLIEHKPKNKYYLDKIRLCESGSSHLPLSLWQNFRDRFGVEIFDRYGTSETGTIALNSLNYRSPCAFNNLPYGVQIKLDINNELLIKSPGLFPGYFQNDKATNDNFTSDRWWRTGDIFILDNNILQLKNRVQEKITKNGYLISPRDIEWAMSKNKLIKDVQVIGMSNNDELNDLIVYFLVSDLSNDAIKDYYKANLPASWRPDLVYMVKELPKTSNGKVSIIKLKELVGAI